MRGDCGWTWLLHIRILLWGIKRVGENFSSKKIRKKCLWKCQDRGGCTHRILWKQWKIQNIITHENSIDSSDNISLFSVKLLATLWKKPKVTYLPPPSARSLRLSCTLRWRPRSSPSWCRHTWSPADPEHGTCTKYHWESKHFVLINPL